MTQRYAEIDWIKVVGIFAVILIHCLRPVWNPNASPAEDFLNQELRFAVPGFLFCSGFLYARTRPFDWRTTLLRLRRIVIPYLVASMGAEIYRASNGAPMVALEVLEDLLTGSAFGHYYYVFIIVSLVLVTPLIAKLPRWLIWGFATLLIANQFVLIVGYVLEWSIFPKARTNFWVFRSPILWWQYFLLGWLVRHHELAIRRWTAAHRMPLAGALGGVCFVLGWLQLRRVDPILSEIAPVLNIFCVIALIGTLAGGRSQVPRPVIWLSEATYAIYLFHLFFLLPIQPYFRHAPLVLDPLVVLQQFVPAVLGPLALIALAQRLLGERSRLLVGA